MAIYTDIYLVDCENVGCRYLKLKNKTSKVYYFISGAMMSWKDFDSSSNTHTLMVADHAGGKDALDFCIDGYLGFLICHFGKKVNYHIVSRDRGFLSMTKFFGELGYFVDVITDLDFVSDIIDLGLEDIPISKLEERKIRLLYPLNLSLRRKLHNIYKTWTRAKKSKAKTVKFLNRQLSACLTRNGVCEDLIPAICDVVRQSDGDTYILGSGIFSNGMKRELKRIYRGWVSLSNGEKTVSRLEELVIPILLMHGVDTSISRKLCEELVVFQEDF